MARALPRTLRKTLLRLAGKFPVVTVTGPRQSGKTTLCRAAFPRLPYENLEAPDVREHAAADPRGFLARFPAGAILDEVQRVPALLSYLLVHVDGRKGRCRFVLSGSQNFGLLGSVSQSLAGRTALLNLLPFSREELRAGKPAVGDPWATIFTGGYPAIHDRGVDPGDWLSSYAATYLERDVRQVLNVADLGAFQDFLRLAAGRSGQVLNLSALGADAGISHNTARSWLGVLEAGFIIHRLRPVHRNLKKRLTKNPKLHFVDSGLLCYLLGIRSPAELAQHPLRGAVFESWVVSEILKHRVHRGLPPDLHFYRDHKGVEVDLVLDTGRRLLGVEMKSGRTVASDAFAALLSFRSLAEADLALVHGGDQKYDRDGVSVVPWSEVDRMDLS